MTTTLPPEHEDARPRPRSHAGVDRGRRRALRALLGAGGGLAAAPALVHVLASSTDAIDVEAIAAAEKLAGLEFTDEERALMLEDVAELRESYEKLRAVPLDNGIPPAIGFDPPLALPGAERADEARGRVQAPRGRLDARPGSDEDLAFASVYDLARLLRERRVSSTELTKLALERLGRLDGTLFFMITALGQRGLDAAARADRELAQGRLRGPLAGVPWGAKDLLAVRGAPTTWGATPYKTQVLDHDATVVTRLDDAGAPLVAKLTLGALAWGDVWFGGTTRNPWNPEEGSSGSSAGSASAVASGALPFAIGSETWGSIVSPSTVCGTTGLRPTFGRVSRHGAMALSWSMDKLGPIARSAADCALVLDAIHGRDPEDPAAVTRRLDWDPSSDPRRLRVGYVPALFEDQDDDDEAARARRTLEREALGLFERLGGGLVALELPDLPIPALSFILAAESAAAFDEFTRTNLDDQLVRQERMAWPNFFRWARTIPAVEYIRANRVRTLLVRELERMLHGVDVLVAPSYGGDLLLATNLTGHPALALPCGFTPEGTPWSITLTGRLFGEGPLITLGHAYQKSSDHHLKRPPVR